MKSKHTGTVVMFERHFIPEAMTGCWLWVGSTNKKGYGRFCVGHGRVRFAHRASYEFYVGPIPDGLCVCHRCDTPQCVNPDHFFLGTTADNTQDALRKGRVARGARVGSSKVTDAMVIAMRRLYVSGVKPSVIADAFGVNDSAAREAIFGVTWSHVQGVVQ